jgi:hypothetical protein
MQERTGRFGELPCEYVASGVAYSDGGTIFRNGNGADRATLDSCKG